MHPVPTFLPLTDVQRPARKLQDLLQTDLRTQDVGASLVGTKVLEHVSRQTSHFVECVRRFLEQKV